MKDVQKGRKSWLERLTSPPEDSEDNEGNEGNEQYDDQTQAFQPFPTDNGPGDAGTEGDERPDEDGGQDYSPEHGRRPESGHDQERPAFGSGSQHQQGARATGGEGRQPDDFDAAFTPRGLRTPPSDFRTGPQDRVHGMGRSPQAPGSFRSGGDVERPAFRRTQAGSAGEPAWGGEPPHASDGPAGGAFGRHDAGRPPTGRADVARPETDRPDAERPGVERPETDRADVERPDLDREARDRQDRQDRQDRDRSDPDLGREPQEQTPVDREQEAPVGAMTERPFTGRAESPEADGRERDSWAGPADDHSSAGAGSVPGRNRQDGQESTDSMESAESTESTHRPNSSDVLAFPDASDVTNDSHVSGESDRRGTVQSDSNLGDSKLGEEATGDGPGANDSVTDHADHADHAGQAGHAERDGAERRRRIDDLQQRWLDAQAKLLDDPRDAAHEAGLLVGEAMVFVTSTFTEHRDRIERDWRDDADLGTDELLSIMRRYRSLFRSVLAASELPEDRR